MKECIICREIKDLSEFYKHKGMADGHLNVCKICKRSYQVDRHKDLMDNNPEYVEKERARGRNKYHRLYEGKKSHVDKEEVNKLKNCRRYFSIRIDLNEDDEIHHWNYNQPKSVIILNRRQHKLIHNHISFDTESQMFKDSNEELLNTLDKHVNLIKSLLDLHELRTYSE